MAYADDPRAKRDRKQRPAEYIAYFTLIFLFTIPSAFIGWMRDIYRERTLLLRGPLARAWAEADRITPVIFSA